MSAEVDHGDHLRRSVVAVLHDELASIECMLNTAVGSRTIGDDTLRNVDVIMTQLANILEILEWNNARDAVLNQRLQLARLGAVDTLRRARLAEEILVALLAVVSSIENTGTAMNGAVRKPAGAITDPLHSIMFAELAAELNSVEALLHESVMRSRPGYMARIIIGLRNIAGSLYFLDMHRAVAVITGCGRSLTLLSNTPPADHEWRLRMVSGVLAAIEQYLYVFPHNRDAAELLLTEAEECFIKAQTSIKAGSSDADSQHRVLDDSRYGDRAGMVAEPHGTLFQNTSGLMAQWRSSPGDTAPAKHLARELRELSSVTAEEGEEEVSQLSQDISLAIDAAIYSHLPVTQHVIEAIEYSLSRLARKLAASAVPV